MICVNCLEKFDEDEYGDICPYCNEDHNLDEASLTAEERNGGARGLMDELGRMGY